MEPFILALMSRAWKFHNPHGLYFISFATVGWIDVFTRSIYKDILVDSLTFCVHQKGLELFAWVLMINHLHLMARADENAEMPGILRDLKKYTSKQVLKSIEENEQESRKEWMLAIFKKAGSTNSNNTKYQFWRQDNKPIELVNTEQTERALNYLHQNPAVEDWVDESGQYKYSSARDYVGIEGLVPVKLL